jgi:drug/metabolite transporter (DMT)-like permease
VILGAAAHGALGELAALGTAVCWAFTSLWFAAAGRRIGSLPVNLLRMPIALLWLSSYGWVVRGHALPLDAGANAWTWLSISGLLGFAFGDLFLFRALILIGPRLGSLVMASAPLFTTVLGIWVLDEGLVLRDIAGMALVTGGIAWAVVARTPPGALGAPSRATLVRGVGFALMGAIGQAAGLVTAKYGMAEYDPFASTQIRVLVGTVAFIVAVTVRGQWPAVRRGLADRRAMMMVSLGGTFGPFLGVGLSLTAAQLTHAGVAASLMALQPILVIPLAVWFAHERVGMAAIGGAVVAIAGVVLLVT